MMSVGLTGSIATGKSEVAKLFSAASIPVFDSDAEVHGLYAEKTNGDLLGKMFPDVIVGGEIDTPPPTNCKCASRAMRTPAFRRQRARR